MKLNFYKHVAFTLAEVLIVIAIIGVTSALVLPNLSKGIDDDKYVMLVRNTYNELETATTKMLADHEDGLSDITSDLADSKTQDKANRIVNTLADYLKMGTNCQAKITTCYNSTKYFLNFDGSVPFESTKRTFSAYLTTKKASTFTLSSGQFVAIYADTDKYVGFFDVDGAGKGPNMYGVDIYRFYITDAGFNWTDDIQDHMPEADTGLRPKQYALSWILTVGNMDYLKASFKDGSDVSYCKNGKALNWSTNKTCN